MKKTKSSGKRSAAIGGNVENSNIDTGDETVLGDKNVYINQITSSTVNALHQLRAPVRDFVGREGEIETLVDALRRGNHVGINGMGGIGKTELALRVAEGVARAYPDAQFFINLQGADANPRSPDEVLAMCIRAFMGAEAALPQDRDQLLQRYRSALNGKRVLLLLDNAADSAQVQLLLPPPGSVVLVTSRQVVSLPGIVRLKLNPLTDEEAQKLLLEIAPHASDAAAQICDLCGYLPLAIRAAGSLLAVTEDLDPVAYATQLKDERKRFEHIGNEGVEIDLAASFNLTYKRLSPKAALVFRLLSVFKPTFDARAEEVVCEDAEHTHLTELVRRSLVLYDTNTKRYRLHDLARLFAASKLNDEENSVGHKRYARHYANVLAVAHELYLQGGEALGRGLALFDLEWSNIEKGHAWVAAQGFEADEEIAWLGLTYPDAGPYVLHLRLHAREFIRWLEIAVSSARRLTHREGEGIALSNLGNAYRNVGETELAIQFFEEALIIARERDDLKNEGITLNNLGIVYVDRGETQRAIEYFEQRLTIARKVGDRRGEGKVLGNLGVAHYDLNEVERALEFFQQALVIARELGDRRVEGNALGNLGMTYTALGETEKAMHLYEQQLTIAREIDDPRSECTALWNMSLTFDRLGQRAQAIQHAEYSLRIHEQIEDPFTEKVRAKLVKWREDTDVN